MIVLGTTTNRIGYLFFSNLSSTVELLETVLSVDTTLFPCSLPLCLSTLAVTNYGIFSELYYKVAIQFSASIDFVFHLWSLLFQEASCCHLHTSKPSSLCPTQAAPCLGDCSSCWDEYDRKPTALLGHLEARLMSCRKPYQMSHTTW